MIIYNCRENVYNDLWIINKKSANKGLLQKCNKQSSDNVV